MSLPTVPLFSLQNLTKKFGSVAALWQVSLDVYPGSCIAIFGPNGAGKSTLLRLVTSLTSPTSGKVEFYEKGDGRQRFGYVSHQSLLYNQMSGLENLLFYGRLYQLQNAAIRAADQLARMGLEEAADQLVGGYSRGMKQRLTLARALLHDPELILLDEPYAGLDQHGSRLLTRMMEGLKEEGRTILLVTHNVSEGLAFSDRILIMNRGELVFEAGRTELDAARFENLYFKLVES